MIKARDHALGLRPLALIIALDLRVVAHGVNADAMLRPNSRFEIVGGKEARRRP
jgi:hypothetical protein